MKKKCAICKAIKPLTAYNNRTKSADGKQPHCRDCNKERSKQYYYSNRKHHIKVIMAMKARRIAEHSGKVFEYLLAHPCIDCGEADPIVLEFDHVRGKKDREICILLHNNLSWKRIEAEIAKCDVRCSNCHKRKTAMERGSYKWQAMQALMM